MDAQQDVTLGEIYRSVQRIEHDVKGVMAQHSETREDLAKHNERIGQVEHFINNAKHAERMKAQVAQAQMVSESTRTGDAISVKSLIALILAIGGAVGALVTAYFKATQ